MLGYTQADISSLDLWSHPGRNSNNNNNIKNGKYLFVNPLSSIISLGMPTILVQKGGTHYVVYFNLRPQSK